MSLQGLLLKLDPTVETPHLIVASVDSRSLFAIANHFNFIGGNTMQNQKLFDRNSSTLTQCHIVLARAALVTIACNEDTDTRIGFQPCGLALQDFLVVRVEAGLIEIEIDAVTDIDGEILDRTGSRARINDAVRLFDIGFVNRLGLCGIGFFLGHRRRGLRRILRLRRG